MDYIRVVFVNTEPVHISDDSMSQSGQTQTLSYIPGSAMRGAVIEELLRSQNPSQREINSYLSESVRFLNAYPVFHEDDEGGNVHKLIPSLKGFYEDKKDTGVEAKPIESVVKDGDIIPGHKRASLGTFGYPAEGTFRFTSMEKSGDLKINLGRNGDGKKNVFRNQYLCSGYEFVAYIGVKNPELMPILISLLTEMRRHDRLILGNARSAGFGKCRIMEVCGEDVGLPYAEYAAGEDNASGVAYMVLLSDTAMLSDEGEITGLREDVLQQNLGVSGLKMNRCSTSVVQVRGYNRTWETHVPSAPMFQMGSVFRLTFEGTLTGESMLKVENEGLGIRKNEGFGRVLFLKDYENLLKKQKINGDIRTAVSDEERLGSNNINNIFKEENRAVLRIAAKGAYETMLERKTEEYLNNPPSKWNGNISVSQMGTARAILSRYRFSPDKGIGELRQYLEHQKEKRDQRNYHKSEESTVEELSGTAADIMNRPLEETLGIRTESMFGFTFEELFRDEISRRKIDLLIRRIDRENREAKKSLTGTVRNGGAANE